MTWQVQLNQNNQEIAQTNGNHRNTKTGPNKQQKTHTKAYAKRGQTKAGLIAFYDIRPLNGAVYSFNLGASTGH